MKEEEMCQNESSEYYFSELAPEHNLQSSYHNKTFSSFISIQSEALVETA